MREGREQGLGLGLGTGVDRPGRALGASSSKARDQDGLDYPQGALWMSSSSNSRQHWHTRQLAAVEMGQQQHQQLQLSTPLILGIEYCSKGHKSGVQSTLRALKYVQKSPLKLQGGLIPKRARPNFSMPHLHLRHLRAAL